MNSIMSPLRAPVATGASLHGHGHDQRGSGFVQPSAAVHAAMQRSALARQAGGSALPSTTIGSQQQFVSRRVQLQTQDPAYYNRPSRANSRERAATDSTNQQSASLDEEMARLVPRVTRLAVSPDQHQQHHYQQHQQQQRQQQQYTQYHRQQQQQQLPAQRNQPTQEFPTLLQQQRQQHLQRQQQPQQQQQHVRARSVSPASHQQYHQQPQQQARPSRQSPQQQQQQQTPPPAAVEWRVAVDPKTKRPYYYHPVTRQTTWKKPQELVDKEKNERASFFASMECNIRAKLREGNWFRDSLTSRPSDLDGSLGLDNNVTLVEEEDDSELSSSTSTSSRSSWSSTTTASVAATLGHHHQHHQHQHPISLQSKSLPNSPEVDDKTSKNKSTNSSGSRRSNQDNHSQSHGNIGGGSASEALLLAAASKPPLLFRTLSSYETPVVNETKKLANGRVIAVPSPIQERMRLAALDDLPRSSDLESYTLKDLALVDAAVATKTPSSTGGLITTTTKTGETQTSRGIARQPLRRRSNSTSTIFVRMGTMNKPDQNTTIQCVSTVLRAHLMEAQADAIQVDGKFEIFVNHRDLLANVIPNLKEIGDFIKHIFARAQMESECIIMTLIYVERLLKATMGLLQLQPANWRSILFCSMVMASKVWDDLSMCNADFSKIWPELSLKEINDLELSYLSAVEYNVRVSAVSYAKYYFHLRSMCASLGMLASFDESAPLNLDGARKMQVLSEEYQERSKLLPTPSRRRSVTITTPSKTSGGGGVHGGSGSNGEAYVNGGSAKWTPAASLEQLVQMQVRGAGGSALSMLPRHSSPCLKP